MQAVAICVLVFGVVPFVMSGMPLPFGILIAVGLLVGCLIGEGNRASRRPYQDMFLPVWFMGLVLGMPLGWAFELNGWGSLAAIYLGTSVIAGALWVADRAAIAITGPRKPGIFNPPEHWRFVCPVCGARVEHKLDVCWNCNYGADGDSSAYYDKTGERPPQRRKRPGNNGDEPFLPVRPRK